MPSVATLTRELRTIRTSFRQLSASFSRIAPALVKQSSLPTSANGSGRRKPHVSAKQRAALKLQGRYMGTLRGLKPRQRARVKKVRAAKGFRAAIAAARRMVG